MIGQIIEKLLIIFILSTTIKGLNESGFINLLIYPVNKFKNMRNICLFWFIIGALVSSVFTDLTTALILLPIQTIYMRNVGINKNKELLLIATCFGICAGGDLTMYGGGDNLVAIGLYKEFYNVTFTHMMWNKYMIPMTLITLIGVFAILQLFIKEETPAQITRYSKIDVQLIPTILLMSVIVLVFKNSLIFAAIILIAAFFIMGKIKELVHNIPYKPMAVWTLAFLFGKIIGTAILNTVDIEAVMSLGESNVFAVMCILTSIITIFCTNTATASCVIGLYMSLFSANPLMFCILLKCINVGYVTIYHNTCLAVGNGYGISQKKLFQVGLPVLFMQLAVILAWYMTFI